MRRRTRRTPADPTGGSIGGLMLGEFLFPIYKGLLATVHQAETAARPVIAAAYGAIADELHLNADRPEKREAVVRRLQQAWYETAFGKEPVAVRERREELWERMGWAPRADEAMPAESRRIARIDGAPSVASLVRKGLLEGSDTKTIAATVQAFGLKCGARTVAFYRHQLRKKGELK